MNKAVIFDLDGTLIDSLPDILDNVNVMLKYYGYSQRTAKEMRAFIGNGARMLVKRSLPSGLDEERVDECLKYYNQAYTNSNSPKTGVFEGVDQLLVALKQKGYKLAILTNKPQMTTDSVYERYLKKYGFDMVVGQSDKIKCKPDKEGAEFILKELNVSAQNCYFIGDGETDVLTAQNAGISCIAVLWGYRDKEQLINAGAKTFALCPSEILNLL